jgi:hypothetical protein
VRSEFWGSIQTDSNSQRTARLWGTMNRNRDQPVSEANRDKTDTRTHQLVDGVMWKISKPRGDGGWALQAGARVGGIQ